MEVRRIPGWIPDDTLQHHGIKGQRWGVRRYQNPDGSLTAAGKDRYLKQVSKSVFETAKDSSKKRQNLSESSTAIANKLNEDGKFKELESYKTYKEKMDEYITKDDYLDYFDSEDYVKDDKRAYKATLEWFKKNDPDYVKDIVKRNNGSTADLDAFHDFRKTYEGFQDEYLNEQKYNEKHKTEYEKHVKLENDYHQARDKFVKDLCGKYANKKVTLGNNYGYYDPFYKDKEKISTIVHYAVYKLDDKKE